MKRKPKPTQNKNVKRNGIIAVIAMIASAIVTVVLWGVTHLIKLIGYCAEALLESGAFPWIAMFIIFGVVIYFSINTPRKRRRR